jgi:beta-glucosidase
MVLLKNTHSLLPLDKKQIRRIALLGSLADAENLGDRGSSEVHPPYTVSPLSGIKKAAGPEAEIDCYTGGRLSKVRKLAGEADAVIVVAGYTYHDEGEKMPGRGGDRTRLTLSERDERIIRAAATENAKCIAVLVCGSAVIMEQWRELVPAVLVSWYPGMEGGNALADILFGDRTPSGKLPFTIPKKAGDLVSFPPDPREIRYDLLHGYRSAVPEGPRPAFHFGFGLSYTQFEYHDFSISGAEFTGGRPAPSDTVRVGLTVKNGGGRDGTELVQVYVGMEDPPVERPRRELKRFSRVFLRKGEERRLRFDLLLSDFAYYDEEESRLLVPPGRYRIEAGGSSRDKDLTGGFFSLEKAVSCN